MTDAPRDHDKRSPGSHPHSDRPNWRPAETADEYLENCREGIEPYSDRRAAKLLGWSRTRVYRAKLISQIPDDLFERLLHELPRVPGERQLAAIALALQSGKVFRDVEYCPHCGGIIRNRLRLTPGAIKLVNDWLASHSEGAP